jgi:hypothetical protein
MNESLLRLSEKRVDGWVAGGSGPKPAKTPLMVAKSLVFHGIFACVQRSTYAPSEWMLGFAITWGQVRSALSLTRGSRHVQYVPLQLLSYPLSNVTELLWHHTVLQPICFVLSVLCLRDAGSKGFEMGLTLASFVWSASVVAVFGQTCVASAAETPPPPWFIKVSFCYNVQRSLICLALCSANGTHTNDFLLGVVSVVVVAGAASRYAVEHIRAFRPVTHEFTAPVRLRGHVA